MATIQKRGTGWRAFVRCRGYPVRTRTFDTKFAAEQWGRDLESQIDAGKYQPPTERVPSLSTAVEKYLAEVSVHKKSHRTEKIYGAKWIAAMGTRTIDKITGKDVADYRNMRQKTVGANTVRLELAFLSHLYTIAIKEWGFHWLVNPVAKIQKPKLPQGRIRRLNPGELDAILAETESAVLKTAALFALETGARRSEISELQWADVDLSNRTALFWNTKNGTHREIPLSPSAIAVLASVDRTLNTLSVWPVTAQAVTRAFERACKKARETYTETCRASGVPVDPAFLVDLNFHDLRHEATSRFFEKGLSTEKVKAITGHKTYSMLARYTHLKASDIAEELARIDM